MAKTRITSNQRKAQAHAANAKIEAAAELIAKQTGCALDAARALVFDNPVLLAECHQVGHVEAAPKDWKEPEA